MNVVTYDVFVEFGEPRLFRSLLISLPLEVLVNRIYLQFAVAWCTTLLGLYLHVSIELLVY